VALCLPQPFRANAQATVETPLPHSLRGKRVGVYISLKNFQYSDDYSMMLSGYVRRSDSLGLEGEELRRAVVIRAGNQLADHLERDLGAESAVYLNALPEIAAELVSAERYKAVPYESLRKLDLDYVLYWDDCRLTAENRNLVRTYSNQVFTVKHRVDQALMQWRVIDVRKKQPLNQLTVNYESDKPGDMQAYLPVRDGESTPEKLFRRAFNLTLALMELSWP